MKLEIGEYALRLRNTSTKSIFCVEVTKDGKPFVNEVRLDEKECLEWFKYFSLTNRLDAVEDTMNKMLSALETLAENTKVEDATDLIIEEADNEA